MDHGSTALAVTCIGYGIKIPANLGLLFSSCRFPTSVISESYKKRYPAGGMFYLRKTLRQDGINVLFPLTRPTPQKGTDPKNFGLKILFFFKCYFYFKSIFKQLLSMECGFCWTAAIFMWFPYHFHVYFILKLFMKFDMLGSAVVVMDKKYYLQEGFRQLSDDKFYEEVPEDLTELHVHKVSLAVNDLVDHGQITEKTAKYLLYDIERTPKFYLLPKIHKSLVSPKGRGIVSGNGSPTEKISQFVDFFLSPLVLLVKSHIRDTSDLLLKILSFGALPKNTILCSLDINAMYPNIPHNEGIAACAEALATHRDRNALPSNSNITELLRLVLECNNFDFAGKHFLQIGGTAMGTKLAPSYANIFMGAFEEKNVYTYKHQPLFWFRFIDDIFFAWTHGEQNLIEFIDYLNHCHNTITFSHEYSYSEVTFLDTRLYFNSDNKLMATLYVKPTDSHNYLLYNSAHPQHIKDSIPYSQFIRIKRICSEWSEFFMHSFILVHHFQVRGYPLNIVFHALSEANKKDRQELLTPQSGVKEREKNSFFFVITRVFGVATITSDFYQ